MEHMTEMTSSTSIRQIRIETNSAEEATALVSNVYNPVAIRPLTGSAFDLKAHAIIVGGLGFSNAFSRSGNHYAFENPFDGYGLSVPVSGNFSFELGKGQSIETDGRKSVLIDSSRVAQASFSKNGAWRRISISTEEMHERVKELTGNTVRGRLHFAPLIERQSHALELLMAFFDLIFDGISDDAPLLSAPAALASITNATLCLLLEALPHDHVLLTRGRVAAPAPRQVKRSIEFIHANAKLPIQLKNIAEAAGVSARSLQLSFKQFRNMSPMAYLRTVRMQGARSELLSCAPGTRVSTVAYEWGFAHMGIFAAQYREMFGETPSATLRRGQ